MRCLDFAQDSPKFLVIFLVSWLITLFNIPLADPDLFDSLEQREPLESDALNPSSDIDRAGRKFSVEAAEAWTGAEGIAVLTILSHQGNPKGCGKRALKIYRLTEVFRCSNNSFFSSLI